MSWNFDKWKYLYTSGNVDSWKCTCCGQIIFLPSVLGALPKCQYCKEQKRLTKKKKRSIIKV
jgi:hypothetical protein